MSQNTELSIKEKKEVTPHTEQTEPGPIFSPDVDIYETDKELTLIADLPGVEAKDLVIDLKDNMLTIRGEVNTARPSGESIFFSEYETGRFYRQFRLSEIIDQEKIEAKQTDGVLHLRLPKLEKAQPRTIRVNGS